MDRLVLIAPAGRLDSDTAATFEKDCTEKLAGRSSCDAVLDLAAVDYISSAGVGAVIKLAKLLQAQHGDLELRNASPAVSRVLALSGVTKLLARASNRGGRSERTLSAHSGAVGECQRFFCQCARQRGVSPEVLGEIELIVEEIVTNILRHAYKGAADDFQISFETDRELLVLEFRDSGPEFDPMARAEPNLDLPVEERPIGGLGIYLVRQLAERVEYERVAEKNVLKVYVAPAHPG